MSQGNGQITNVGTCGVFAVVAMFGVILAVVAGVFTLLLGWLAAWIVPLLPLWPASVASALVFLATVLSVARVQPLASLTAWGWIFMTTGIATSVAVALAWLTTRFTDMTISQALLPTTAVAIAIVYYFLHLLDELLSTWIDEESFDSEDESVRIVRLRSLEQSIQAEAGQEKRRTRRRKRPRRRDED